MKTPICELCTKTEALCSGCEAKLREGKLSELEVSVSRLLNKLSGTYNLETVDFYKAIDLEKVVILLTRGDVGLLIGKEGKVVNEISQSVGKKVRIAELAGDLRKTVEDLVLPVRVLGINTIFKSGDKAYRVRFARNEQKMLPVAPSMLEKALHQLFEADVTVAFE